jgi:hypothetical protein
MPVLGSEWNLLFIRGNTDVHDAETPHLVLYIITVYPAAFSNFLMFFVGQSLLCHSYNVSQLVLSTASGTRFECIATEIS